jgi:hypothetical protein
VISNELMEKLETEYARSQRCMWNSIVRAGWDTPMALETLGSWYDLYDLPNIGPRRLLSLVNFIRENGGELPWFAQWDEDADRWELAGDLHRVPAVQPL